MTPKCCWVTWTNIKGRRGNMSTISYGEEFLISYYPILGFEVPTPLYPFGY